MPAHLVMILLTFGSFAFAENPDQESPERIQSIREQIKEEFAETDESRFDKEISLSAFDHLDPRGLVPSDLLRQTMTFYVQNQKKFSNQNYISIVDFTPRSNKYRLYVINLKTGFVERFRTTHGEGSDSNQDGFAESFGNVPGSKKSSLGYVRTAEVYNGTFGRSLRLDGLSSTNSRIRERAVVFHGWSPVVEANQIQPLSWGCVTIDLDYRDGIIDKIKNGSLIFVGLSQ